MVYTDRARSQTVRPMYALCSLIQEGRLIDLASGQMVLQRLEAQTALQQVLDASK